MLSTMKLQLPRLLALVSLLCSLLVPSASAASCTLCVNGNDAEFANVTKTFNIPGLLMKTCGELVDVAELLDADSDDCKSVQTWGTYCECPVPQDACTICEPGLVPFFGFSLLRQLKPSEFNIFGATSFTVLTCETFDSALNVLAKEGDDFCTRARTLNNGLQKCSCADPNSGGVGVLDDMPVMFDPNSTNPPTPAPVSVCTVCPQGDDDVLVNATKEFRLPGLLVETCGELVQAASLYEEDSPGCSSIRTLASYCGCPAPDDSCGVCPPGKVSFFPDAPLRQINASDYDIFGASSGTTVSCEILDSALHLLATEGDELCQATRLKNNGLQKCSCDYPNSTGVPVTDDMPLFLTLNPTILGAASPAPVVYDRPVEGTIPAPVAAPVLYGPVKEAVPAPITSPVSYGGGDEGGSSKKSGSGKSGKKGSGKSGSGKSSKSGKRGSSKSGKSGKSGSGKHGKSEKTGGREDGGY